MTLHERGRVCLTIMYRPQTTGHGQREEETVFQTKTHYMAAVLCLGEPRQSCSIIRNDPPAKLHSATPQAGTPHHPLHPGLDGQLIKKLTGLFRCACGTVVM